MCILKSAPFKYKTKKVTYGVKLKRSKSFSFIWKCKMSVFLIFTLVAYLSRGWCETAAPAAQTDPEMVQYLQDQFARAKELNRPLVNGEMNLLPQGMEGFSNGIRCFFDASTPSEESEEGNSRILKFNLSSLSQNDKIVAMQLVLKQDNASVPYTVTLYEVIAEKSVKAVRMLDSGEYHGQWHTLDIVDVEDSKDEISGNRNYQLALALTSKDGRKMGMDRILRTIKPMLLVYISDLSWMKEFKQGSPEENRDNVRRSLTKRHPKRERGKRSASTMELTLEQRTKRSCTTHQLPSSFDVVKFIFGSFNTLISPSTLNFAYCHGACVTPTSISHAHMYNNHATLMALAAPELSAVSPCCVQNDTKTISVVYSSSITNFITMVTYNEVLSCRCL